MSGLNSTKHHYVYRITNKKLNKHYYGVRSCSCKPVEDLGRKYFSSSSDKEFMKDQKEHPEDYKYKIIKEFDNRKDAEYLEKYLHEKFNVAANEHFYNRCKSTLMGFSVEGTHWTEEHHKKMKKFFENQKRSYEERFGPEKANKIKEKQRKPKTEETKRKISIANTGKHHSEETKQKMRKPKTEETKRKISIARTGQRVSEETKEKISVGLCKTYASKSKEEREAFRMKMDAINKDENKRKDDSEKLKAIWADPVRSKELWGNRRHRSSYVIKMTRPDGSSETFKGLNRMCEDHNFSKYIVREALKNGKPIEDYLKFSHTNKYTNLTGYKFELLKMES